MEESKVKDASWFPQTGCCPEPMKTRFSLRVLAIIIIIIIIIMIIQKTWLSAVQTRRCSTRDQNFSPDNFVHINAKKMASSVVSVFALFQFAFKVQLSSQKGKFQICYLIEIFYYVIIPPFSKRKGTKYGSQVWRLRKLSNFAGLNRKGDFCFTSFKSFRENLPVD